MNEKSPNTPNLCCVREECDNQETKALTSETSRNQKLAFCLFKPSPLQLLLSFQLLNPNWLERVHQCSTVALLHTEDRVKQ